MLQVSREKDSSLPDNGKPAILRISYQPGRCRHPARTSSPASKPIVAGTSCLVSRKGASAGTCWPERCGAIPARSGPRGACARHLRSCARNCRTVRTICSRRWTRLSLSIPNPSKRRNRYRSIEARGTTNPMPIARRAIRLWRGPFLVEVNAGEENGCDSAYP